jgi:hypothetical protein
MSVSDLTNLTDRRKFGNGLFNEFYGFYGSKEVQQRILRILRILGIEGRKENKYSAIEIACRPTKRAR